MAVMYLMEKVDIAIAGGGPAGLTLAKNLAEAGVSFVLLEDHKDFFQKPCGEGLCRVAHGVNMIELHGSKAGFENEIESCTIYINQEPLKTLEWSGYTLDKQAFEKDMYRQAVKSGGDMRLGQKIEAFEKTADGILIKPQGIKCKCLVGCDGTFSKARGFFGQKIEGMVFAVAAYEQKKGKDTDLKLYLGKGIVDRGYAWRFPKKSTYNVGVGSTMKEAVMPSYERLFKAKGPRGAFIPYGLPCKTYFDSGILIGDAAGQADSLTGGGIDYSMIASKLAAGVLIKLAKSGKPFSEENLREYEKLWRKAIYKPIRNDYILGKLLLASGIYKHELLVRKLSGVLDVAGNAFKKL
jgi:flavin-dependent dehydrogenase